jgi:hypothetical protein
MQNYNIFMTALQLILAFHIIMRVSSIKYLTECTLSELNRITDRTHEATRFGIAKAILAVIAMAVVWWLDHPIANAVQVLLSVISIWLWAAAIKEQSDFELILLKRQVDRVGRKAAVDRLHKQAV